MAHDFEFLQGTWHSTHRRLVAPLTGSDEWEAFTGQQVARAIFGGAGNMDEITFPEKQWGGITVRLYNPETEMWSLYWISSRRDVIDAPQVGRFVDGRGEFFGEDVYDGTAIKVRYVWSDITPTSAHWEQAFSTDAGQTWQTNWVMELTRVD